MSLVEELEAIGKACDSAGVEYALCGGLSLAVHGLVRATIDIDILVPPQQVMALSHVVQSCGFTIPSMDMTFGAGAVEMKRFMKITDDGNVIPVDLLVVTPDLQPVWDSRVMVEWNGMRLGVASRAGLIMMKQLSGRPQDLIDIERLQNE